MRVGANRIAAQALIFFTSSFCRIDASEIALQLGVHLVLLEASDQAGEHPAQGLDRPLKLDHLAREFVGAPADAGVPRENLDLYLVYVVLQAPYHGRVAFHPPIHDRGEERLRST